MRHFKPWVLIVPAMLIAAPAIAQEEGEAEAPAEEQAPPEVGEEVTAEDDAAPVGEVVAEEADAVPEGEAQVAEGVEATPVEADEPPEEEEPADEEEPLPTHDWEYVLTPTSNAPNSSGLVKVTAVADTNSFVVELAGLPPVDSLDQDGRDVNAYTIWVVPGRERVLESTLAGAVTIDADGSGALVGATTLPTFGVIVTATPDGAPATISGIPILTGIPVEPQAPEAGAEGPEGEAPAEGEAGPELEPTEEAEGEAPPENEIGPEPVEEPATEEEDPAPAETEP